MKYIDKMKINEHLEIAIEENQFHLVYQPKINLKSGRIVGMEALLRWNHPEKGMISPLDFIPVAEETDLIVPIGEWVLREACEQNMKWRQAGLGLFTIAVNLSVRQLYQPNFVEKVEQILTESGLSPKYLELEITENIMMDVAHTLPVIKALKKLGIRLSLDDFGTGYSSLSYLKEYPFDQIKIDRSFLCASGLNSKDELIIKATIAMAQQLNLAVVAEGVETIEQLVFLQKNRCDQGQGYFFSKPLLPEDILVHFDQIEQLLQEKEVLEERCKQASLEEILQESEANLRETVHKQQGMIFKFIKRNGKFVHTIADGELLYKIGLTPELLTGKSLDEIWSSDPLEEKIKHYELAWQGNENVTYEGALNGVHYFASLQPVWENGHVIEVIGSAVDITKRVESEDRFQKITDYTFTAVLIYRDAHILKANPAARSVLGEDVVGRSLHDLIVEEDLQKFPKQIARQSEQGFSIRENCLHLKNGKTLNVEITFIPTSYEGEPAILALFSDETKRIQTERTIEDVNYALDESSIVAITDRRGIIQYVNDKVTKITQYKKEELIGQNHRLLNSGYHPKSFFKDMWQTIGQGDTWRGEICNRAKDGSSYWVDTTIVPFLNEKNIPYQYVSIRTEITERKKIEEALRISEEKLKYIAFHDALTNIPNRRSYLKKLAQYIQIAQDQNKKFAVVYIDIDRFKEINDTLGHDVGDIALKEFVEKVKLCIHPDIVFARQGGDEFTLLIPIEKDENEVLAILERILEQLQKPASINRKLLASLGVAIYPTDGTTKDALLRHADQALYKAKEKGRNRYQVYSKMN